ncbi:5-carboxymethyl-2-hydroxymuconate Delta-isomerase [Kordiimonas pumila]|uniref:5-carboxymethyl-2-hydroxymuconate Delta-isomerase n=1 Tax=Kordiimonas pumila TaxID=2161677 RepID=A0ABV7D489_9PROT|nr:hypothetical protein [Kordiimonas pumila]
MPHISVEYARDDDLDCKIEDILDTILEVADQSSVIVLENLKLRAIPCSQYRVSGRKGEAFLHVNVAMMEGPSLSAREELSDALFAALTKLLPDLKQITIDLREMNPRTYRKR